MIDRSHELPLTGQAKALGISRGSVYYLARPTSDADLALMRRIDELHLEHPFAGSRMLRDMLKAEGREIGRRHASTLMKKMGVEAIYRRQPRLPQEPRRPPRHPCSRRPALPAAQVPPDLNPIEMLFSKLKQWLRKTAARTQHAVCDAIAHILGTVTANKCLN